MILDLDIYIVFDAHLLNLPRCVAVLSAFFTFVETGWFFSVQGGTFIRPIGSQAKPDSNKKEISDEDADEDEDDSDSEDDESSSEEETDSSSTDENDGKSAQERAKEKAAARIKVLIFFF